LAEVRLLGFVTISYALFAILLASSEGADWGWTGTRCSCSSPSGALSLALFVVIELEVDTPLLDVRVFRSWIFTNALVLVTVVSVGLNAVLFYLPQYMQAAHGLTALNSGITLLPQAMAMALTMPVAGKLYDLFGARWLVVTGLLAPPMAVPADQPDSGHHQDGHHGLDVAALHRVGMAMMPIMAAGYPHCRRRRPVPAARGPMSGSASPAVSAWPDSGALVSAQQTQMMSDRGALMSTADGPRYLDCRR